MRNSTKIFLILLFTFFLTKLWLAFRPHVVFWDEAVYIGMGKFIFSYGTAGLWEILRPVILPIILGVIWKISYNPLFIGELIMIAFACGYAAATYLLSKEIFNEDTGAFTGLVLLITPLFFFNTGFFMTEIFSSFLIMLSLLLLVKKKYFFSGISSGLGILARFPHGLILASVISLMRKEKKVIRYITGAGILLLIFMLFNYFLYKDETNFLYAAIRPFIFGAAHQSNPFAPTGNVLFYFTELVKDNFLLLFGFFGIYLFFRKKLYNDKKISLIFVTLIIYIIYYSLIYNKQLRFTLTFLGLLAISTGYCITLLWGRKWLKPIIVILFIIAGYSSINQDITYAGWRSDTEPPIVEEYYRFFNQENTLGPVLTSDPVPAAYSDKLFIPYYFTVNEGKIIVESEINRSAAIIYTSYSLPCMENDVVCKESREWMLKLISSNKLVFNRSYYGQEHLIFKTR